MTKLRSGKEEVVYLLKKVIAKYQTETGTELILNTNRKNYQQIAILLSEISNQLPQKYIEWGAMEYEGRERDDTLEYPYRKYDITGGQIKEALTGIVSNPRSFLVDACYVYLFGVGRKEFEKNPLDENLIAGNRNNIDITSEVDAATDNRDTIKTLEKACQQIKRKLTFTSFLAAFLALVVIGLLWWNTQKNQALAALKKDMTLLPYKPSQVEIDSLQGIWLCYTGSPQARISYLERYHKVVSNLVDIKYKNGYFVFNRYGASFDHIGYMQFESPGIVSIYSRIDNKTGKVESPRHSLMNLYADKDLIPAVSASWNFDAGDKNRMVGIREVYKKLGTGGQLQETINQIENASCQCKIVKWIKPDKTTQSFYLKNMDLDSIQPPQIRSLIDEKSILLSEPDSMIIRKQTVPLR